MSRRYIWVTLAVVALLASAAAGVALAFLRGGPWDGPPPQLTWSDPEPLMEGGWADIACPAPHDCWIVGAAAPVVGTTPALLRHLVDGAWQPVTLDLGRDSALHGIACRSERRCWAVGEIANPSAAGRDSGAILLRYEGSSWVEEAFPDLPLVHLRDIACSGAHCVVVGDSRSPDDSSPRPVVAREDDGAWSLVPGDQTVTGYLSSVSCPSSKCSAVGRTADGTDALVVTADDSWRTEPPAALAARFDPRIACTSSTHCLVLGAGSDGNLVSLNGDAHTPAPNSALETWSGFGCFTERFCWAAGAHRPTLTGDAGVVYFFDGQTWLRQSLPATTRRLTSIDCPLWNECWAVGVSTDGQVIALRGRA